MTAPPHSSSHPSSQHATPAPKAQTPPRNASPYVNATPQTQTLSLNTNQQSQPQGPTSAPAPIQQTPKNNKVQQEVNTIKPPTPAKSKWTVEEVQERAHQLLHVNSLLLRHTQKLQAEGKGTALATLDITNPPLEFREYVGYVTAFIINRHD